MMAANGGRKLEAGQVERDRLHFGPRLMWWPLLAVLVHLAFLATVAAANGWTLQPLIDAHDGEYYVAHLADPLLQGDVEWWDNVPYRALRSGYVLVSLPFRWLGVVPALIVANLVAVAMGTHLIRMLASRHGANVRLAGLVWILNPGALIGTAFLLPDTIAWVAILLAMMAMVRSRWGWATILTIVAVMTKEASLVAIGLAALMMAWRERKPLALLPVVTAGVLHVSTLAFLVWRFGPTLHTRFLDWPLVGWVQVYQHWGTGVRGAPSAVVGTFFLVVGIVVVVRWWRSKSFYLAPAAGHALLMLMVDGGTLAPLVNTTRIGGLFLPLLFATTEERDRAG